MRLLGIAFIGRAARADGGGCALDGLDNFLQHHHAETDRDDFSHMSIGSGTVRNIAPPNCTTST